MKILVATDINDEPAGVRLSVDDMRAAVLALYRDILSDDDEHPDLDPDGVRVEVEEGDGCATFTAFLGAAATPYGGVTARIFDTDESLIE